MLRQQLPVHRLARAALLAALGAALAPAASAQSWTLFDDFTSGALSPTKWHGEEGRQFNSIRLEASRSVVSGQLRLSARGYGDNQRDSGSGQVRNSVVLVKSAAVTAMKGTITMRAASLVNCTANPNITGARARLFGFFFNSGQPVAGSFLNDVFAGVQVGRAANSTDPAGTFRINGFVGTCLDDGCNTSSTIVSKDLGTVTLNVPVTLSMVWSKGTKTFSFQRDADPVQSYTYTLNDTAGPEGTNNKRVEVSSNLAQCVAARSGVNAMADFDNIYTNTLPATPALTAPPAGELQYDPVVGTVN